MGFAPSRWLYRKRLYRNGMFAVTLAGCVLLTGAWLAAQVVTPQYGHRPAPDKGPRALGLVEVPAKGKARIIPIAIMMDGKFYDAGSYKASPVPMALDFGVVYEGFRAGVSQGLFTITQPGQLNHVWIAEGKWLPAGAVDPNKKKKYSAPVIADNDNDDRPVLHRRTPKADSDSGSADTKDKDNDKNKDADKDQDKDQDKDRPKLVRAPSSTGDASPASAPNAGTTASSTDNAKPNSPASSSGDSAPAPAPASASDETIADPNRPRLRRGKPDATEHHEPFTTFDPSTTPVTAASLTAGKPGAVTKDSADETPQVTVIPAISDANGPDPRPYNYDVKPAEEAIYRNKMFELATAQLRAGADAPKDATPTHKKTASKGASKLPDPSFDDVSLGIFDLSNSNEPVLVLSAKTRPVAGEGSQEAKEITLIARTNLEGELRKLFFSQTDSRHMDVTPRMQLIDAVDADGDGRGELLFRRTFNDGSAYAIYRVSADRLWPLFEETP